MKISDEIALSARNLARRKGRTALTLIGVVIGTCMVVLMISLGIAQTQANDEMLQSWGDLTQIQVYGGMAMGPDGQTLKLDDAAIESFKELDHVQAATAYISAYNLQGQITAGRGDRYAMDLGSLTGVDPAAMEPMGFVLSSGRWPDTGPANRRAEKLQVLVCDYTGYNFYDTRRSMNSPKRYRWQGQTDALGNPVEPFVDPDKETMTLTIRSGEEGSEQTQTWELEVVGHIQQDASKGWWTQSNIILRSQDLKMVQEAYNKMARITTNSSQGYDQVYVKVDELENVSDVEQAIHDMGFENTYSMNQQREEMQQQVMRSQMIFGGVAAVSLLVAAINIINTMTMAIYERTREIGVMKVLGCELNNIRAMFLMESSCIGFLGGVVGVLISVAVSFLLNNLSTILAMSGQSLDLSGLMGGMYYGASSTMVSVIPPWLMLAALAFATLVGLVSGILPANKAVRISALEAIRHD
ncbi:MAG TPA: ABC transporter permease [Candidatus Gemmiger avistercoris]|uniref:ABC transporter permease n=1 Tax=Candidatus Gemmiger avistercoris TaxID=2838606 RepID=A0A9D2JP48_9FIRM|nr:ABC transporter permease [uncultured Subdoligranulum sp.]HIZ61252.1 ABC transporter permease [Candidatus Gemmiger avistercoris]